MSLLAVVYGFSRAAEAGPGLPAACLVGGVGSEGRVRATQLGGQRKKNVHALQPMHIKKCFECALNALSPPGSCCHKCNWSAAAHLPCKRAICNNSRFSGPKDRPHKAAQRRLVLRCRVPSGAPPSGCTWRTTPMATRCPWRSSSMCSRSRGPQVSTQGRNPDRNPSSFARGRASTAQQAAACLGWRGVA
jgi:hypothetical protein